MASDELLEIAQKKINKALKEIEHMQNRTGNICCHEVMEIIEQILAPERFRTIHVRSVERIKPDIDTDIKTNIDTDIKEAI